MYAAIREQPLDIIDAETGSKMCTVKAGPKTVIEHMKHEIAEDTGIPIPQQRLLFGDYKYKDFDHVGIDIFKQAMEQVPQVIPEIQLHKLSEQEAEVEQGRHKAIEEIKHGKHMLNIEEEYRGDPEVVLFAVQHTNPAELQHASDAIKCDRDVMLQALKVSSTCMYYVADDLWHDREFVKGAVSIDGLLIGASMMPAEWRADREILMYACESHGYALKHASEELKNDRVVVLAAVNQKGVSLMYASEEMREDSAVVLDAVRNNRMAIVHARGDLREDDEIRAAAGQGPSDKMVDHEKLDKIKAQFHKLDVNGDGYLSYEELQDLLKKGNPDMQDDEIRLLYDQMDTHHDERVDFHEFCDFIFGE